MSAVATPPGITEAAYQQLSDEDKRRLGYQRPLTDQEFAQLTPEQLQNLGFAPKQQGAPADFGGTVYPNPDNLKPFSDTDAPAPTRLPTGVSFQHQNSTGQMPTDTSNPPAAQLAAPGSTVGANFSPDTPPLPAGYQLDQASDTPPLPAGYQLDSPTPAHQQTGWLDKEIPLTSYGAATEQGIQSIAKGFRDTAKGMWDTLGAPPKDKTEAAMFALGGPTLVPVYRTLVGAGHSVQEATQIASAVHDINNSSDPAGTYAKVLQQTAGQGAAQALTALATEGVIKVAPKVPAAVTEAATETAPRMVRAATRGANKALAKAPGTIGGTAGAAAGGYLGGHIGAEIGGAAGAMAGRELLPQITIPGEGFGLPNRVTGGPAEAPEYTAPAETSSAPQSATPVEPKKLDDLLSDALGGKPLEPNVPLRAQTSAKPPLPKASDLPEGFTPVQSSALKGYKYNPDTQEFDGVTNTGQVYRHGEVTPDQVKAFESADSKGVAWNTLRNNATPLGKVNNGVLQPRIPSRTVVEDPETGKPEFSDVVKAKQGGTPANADLTDLLQKSLDQAKASKPNYVYRARDADETGVPLQPNSRAQATSDLQQAMGFAEPGQRSGDWGQVVRIDLNKLKPSDYIIHPHPDGMQWVQFKRPLSESEVTPFAGKGVGAKQNVGSNQVNQ